MREQMSEDTPPDPGHEPDLTPEQQDDILAAEIALGLAAPDDAQQAVARLAADPAFAQRVRDWQERLAVLAEELTPVMPPVRARQRIREDLGHISAPLSHMIDSRIRWWQRPLPLISAAAGAVAAVALVVMLALPVLRGPELPSYQAALASSDATMRVDARVDGREVEVMLMDGTVPEGRDWQVWWISPDGSAPVSLGLVARKGPMRTSLPEGIDMVEGVRIALSEEPAGGSPTGQATGPMFAMAPLRRS